MNNNQSMITSKQAKQFPKTKLLKEQILTFQNTLTCPFDKKYTKISVQNKKKTGIHKTKTVGVFDEKKSLTDSSKDTTKPKKNQKENLKKLQINMPNGESVGKDISICSLSIQTEDKNKDEKEDAMNSKRISEKHVLDTKYSLKKLLPELRTHITGIRDSSVKERRSFINMFPGKIPMSGLNHLLLCDRSANTSAWNSNNNTNLNTNLNAQAISNKFQVVKKEKTLTLLKKKENKLIKEARDKEKEIEKNKMKDNCQELNDNEDCFSYKEEKPCELTDDEKVIYGNREMRNYKKQFLLGK